MVPSFLQDLASQLPSSVANKFAVKVKHFARRRMTDYKNLYLEQYSDVIRTFILVSQTAVRWSP